MRAWATWRQRSARSSAGTAAWAAPSATAGSTPRSRSSAAIAGASRPCSARPSATVAARAASSTRPTRSSRSSVSATAAASNPRSSSRCRSSARVRALVVSSRRAAAWAASADAARSPSSGAPPPGRTRLVPTDARRPTTISALAPALVGLGGSELVLVFGLVGVGVGVGGGGGGGGEADAQLGLDLLLDLAGQLGVVAEEVAGVLAALAELVAVVGEPGPRLLDQADVHADIQQAALLGDPLAVDDIELGRAERRGQLVLDHLGPGPVADHLGAVLQRLDPPHVEPDRGVELERPPPG